MNKEALLDKTQMVVEGISENRYLKSISKGMVSTIPAIIAGALFTILMNLPIEGYQNFLVNNGLKPILSLPIQFTSNIIALIVVYFVSVNIVRSFNVDSRMVGLLGIISFLLLTPLGTAELDEEVLSFIAFDWLGAKGMFVAILVGLLVGRLYAFFMMNKIYIRMPKTVPSFVERSFASLIPFFLIILLFTIISWLFTLTSFEHVHELIYVSLQVPLQNVGGSIGGVLVAYFAMSLLWWFGIHGKSVVFAIVAPIWASLTIENLTATNAGEIPPNIIDFGFTTIFMEIGGAGGVLSLMFLLILFSKSKRYKSIGKITSVPTFFGISEPIIFGTPIVLNPYFFVPVILTPIVTGLLAYVSILIGIVPGMSGTQLPTGTPALVDAFIIAGWRAILVQIVCIIVGMLIYYPFFRAADKKAVQEEKEETEEQAREQAKEEAM